MAERKIVYATGLPGVGKTTLCKGFVQNHPGWITISGGGMIMRATGHLPEAERDKLRETNGYQSRQNQLRILQSFREVLAETAENILFDGQCVVRLADRSLRPIPASIPVRMGISKVVYVVEPPEVIIHRRLHDAQRPGREVETRGEILKRLEVSEEISRRYADKAGVPFSILHSPLPGGFAKAVCS